ncbi:acetoin utilization protein AcuC [Hoyosella subflava]|uniref:Acetoin utilization protein AcuC n=1 Tax=Hoyosella subflava (strain DSM 45089 / JCM 17490 / NBRC 109087 / DQS3-9A1) TaxID=443218 RepID=F6ELF3_HOYSD|nr:acetoin utilization protein AcuC [Hoyosella subflava]AEF40203.1 Putative acetoin utilization protein [Hoyosella subflava DQS3-9A1]
MRQHPEPVPYSVIWTPEFLSYRLSESHPMNPLRLELTIDLAESLGILAESEIIRPDRSSEQELLRVHTPAYLAAVQKVSAPDSGTHRENRLIGLAHGLGNDDNPVFPAMHDAGMIVAGGTLAAAHQIHSGLARRVVSIAGGMHHAMPNYAAGFCIYNDCAIAISWLLDHGYTRIAYIDVDVHHGDGVQHAFYDDPRVMTISLHQHPATLWPGTGWPAELGDGAAEGTSINVPMLPGTPDSLWLRAFHAIVPGAIRAFEPQIIVSQCGADTHREDPLADLALTVDGQRLAFRAMRDLADECCEGRWLAVGGGGYGLIRVVPRSWTHLIALAAGIDIDPATAIPDSWKERARGFAPDIRPPERMGDEGRVEFDRWSGSVVGPVTGPPSAERELARIDSAILETRRAVFPLLGLDPDDPRD